VQLFRGPAPIPGTPLPRIRGFPYKSPSADWARGHIRIRTAMLRRPKLRTMLRRPNLRLGQRASSPSGRLGLLASGASTGGSTSCRSPFSSASFPRRSDITGYGRFRCCMTGPYARRHRLRPNTCLEPALSGCRRPSAQLPRQRHLGLSRGLGPQGHFAIGRSDAPGDFGPEAYPTC